MVGDQRDDLLDSPLLATAGAYLRLMEVTQRIFISKLASRGHDNLRDQGIPGIFIRMYADKMARVKRVANAYTIKLTDQSFDVAQWMQQSRIDPHDVVDDLMDIANYAIIFIMVMWDILGTDTFSEEEQSQIKSDVATLLEGNDVSFEDLYRQLSPQ